MPPLADPPPAVDAPRWSGSATLATSIVAGPRHAGATVRTLDGALPLGPTSGPSVDVALALGVTYDLRRWGALSLRWAAHRDVALVDTGDAGFAQGNGGSGVTTGIETFDPVLAWSDPDLARRGPVHLALGARYALPLSRASLVCNPSFGGLGATVGGVVDLGPRSAVAVVATADRALHRHDAAPRGRCGVGELTADTLSGPATAAAIGWSAANNPAWVFEQALTLTGWHGLFALVPAWSDRPGWDLVTTGASVGLRERIDRRPDAATVATLSGEVAVDAGRVPAVAAVPWSVSLGVRPDPHVAVAVTVANQLPTLLYDPGARLRALPATTSTTLAVTGSW